MPYGLRVSVRDGAAMARDLAQAGALLKQLRLDQSSFAVREARSVLLDLKQWPRTAIEISKDVQQAHKAISKELNTTLFMRIPADRRAYYNKPELLGDKVAQAFPSAAFDVAEAGKCLATGRSTAAVLHLMRVVEVGLRALAVAINPSADVQANPTWDAVLQRGDREIAKRAADQSPEWRERAAFYTEAIANLRAVKAAWRNPTMHVERKYTDEEAVDVFNAVKAFMRHLATQVRET